MNKLIGEGGIVQQQQKKTIQKQRKNEIKQRTHCEVTDCLTHYNRNKYAS